LIFSFLIAGPGCWSESKLIFRLRSGPSFQLLFEPGSEFLFRLGSERLCRLALARRLFCRLPPVCFFSSAAFFDAAALMGGASISRAFLWTVLSQLYVGVSARLIYSWSVGTRQSSRTRSCPGDSFTSYLTLGQGRRHGRRRQHIRQGDNPDRL
jgi:hypothetical protein